MPVAGFYAIHNSEIRFASDGQWYADGERIANQRIDRLFSRSIERGDDGYILRVGDETASIIVDDTPYVVTAVDVGEDLLVTLNDGSTEHVGPEHLELGESDVFYCRVKHDTEAARFLRPAHYQLADHIRENANGGFSLRLGSRVSTIRRR